MVYKPFFENTKVFNYLIDLGVNSNIVFVSQNGSPECMCSLLVERYVSDSAFF